MFVDKIQVKGAKVNNLKNVDLEIPINKITCLIGPSGSGKSSLAFHTLYAESKRRFLNSFPTYLKFFSDRPAPVDVDSIEPVLPVFGLPQINPVVGTRANVADTMHLTELLQNIYASASIELCPKHNCALEETTLLDYFNQLVHKAKENEVIYILTGKEDFISQLKDSPFPNRSFDTEKHEIRSFEKDDYFWELERGKVKSLSRLVNKIEPYLKKKIPMYIYIPEMINLKQLSFKSTKKCPKCGYTGLSDIHLAYFSPYNALGACETCGGFGSNLIYDENKLLKKHLSVKEGGVKFLEYKRFGSLINDLKSQLKKNKISLEKPIEKLPKKFFKILYEGEGKWCGLNDLFDYLESKKYKASVRIFIRGIQKEVICDDCQGSRLRSIVHNYYLFKNQSLSYKQIWDFSIQEILDFFTQGSSSLYESKDFTRRQKNKIIKLLKVAIGIGLGHLNINRKSKTVSAGEYQRLLLLKYLSYEGTGALFVFDEPSLGLSKSEMKVLFSSFKSLVDAGNTVVLVEHSEYFIKNSDYIIKIGPQAGKFGGEVLYEGKFKKSLIETSLEKINKNKIVKVDRQWITVDRPNLYNKVFPSIKFPIHEIVHVRGMSGSGKSAILVNTLANKMNYDLYETYLNIEAGKFKDIKYPKDTKDVIVVDANLNRYSSRSTVGSLTGLFGIVRKHFLKTPAAKSMGLKEGHLSANSALGQCPNCDGKGVKIVEMQFLEDIVLTCEDCEGRKIKPLYSSLTDGHMTVYEAFSNPLSSVIPQIKLTPKYKRIWEYMKILKLDYLSLDRLMNSLSGGEKQRLYLLSKLEKEVKNSLIIFENISFGLSKNELNSLCLFFNDLVILNNTVVIIDQDDYFQHVATYTLEI